MADSREDIIRAIQHMARNDGKPPGEGRFQEVTGFARYNWEGRYWARWSDAVREAGLVPQRPPERLEDELLLEAICRLAIRLKRFPSAGELLQAKKEDPTFPHRTVIQRRFGTRDHLLATLRRFVLLRPDFSPLASILPPAEEVLDTSPAESGLVYLVSDGDRFKIGRTQSVEGRIPELSYQNSRRIDLVHKIETDDPAGVERYWHERFAGKRKFGEWFELDRGDVAAFRRWKKIH